MMRTTRRKYVDLLLGIVTGTLIAVLLALATRLVRSSTTYSVQGTEDALGYEYFSRPSSPSSPSKFVHPLEIYKSNRTDLPIPVKIVEDYIREHSVQSLEVNPDLEHRRFAVGLLSCPNRAGNRIHEFINALHWAILTNRTFLWQYRPGHEKCVEGERKAFAHKNESEKGVRNTSSFPCIANEDRTEEACNAALVRAPWVPMYKEWSYKLGLCTPRKLSVFRDESAAQSVSSKHRWRDLDKKGSIDENRKAQVVYFPDIERQFSLFEEEEFRQEMLGTPAAREIAIGLQALGSDFLFGMLARYTFELSDSVRFSNRNPAVALDTDTTKEIFTIGVHSRHIRKNDDGCDVTREWECIRSVLMGAGVNSSTVIVSIMADRECTIGELRNRLIAQNMTTLAVDHTIERSGKGEHGPFAGLGFFRDLSLVGRVRSALVGTCRSSTQLVLERIEFQRKMELWDEGVDVTLLDDIQTCRVNGHVVEDTEAFANIKDCMKSTHCSRVDQDMSPTPSDTNETVN